MSVSTTALQRSVGPKSNRPGHLQSLASVAVMASGPSRHLLLRKQRIHLRCHLAWTRGRAGHADVTSPGETTRHRWDSFMRLELLSSRRMRSMQLGLGLLMAMLGSGLVGCA